MHLSITNLKTLMAASLLMGSSAMAGTVQVAVASNFIGAMEELVPAFQKGSGHQVAVVPGSTGKFYSQIQSGAPFEVLLSADQATPAKLEKEGLAVEGTQFSYAEGQLVLWSETPGFIDDGEKLLKAGRFKHLSLANPKTAPYGAAAMEVIHHLGLEPVIESKTVLGENIAQAHQFVATGNADLGFLALSQVATASGKAAGSMWLVPSSWHSPILQNAVLLHKGKDNAAALALMAFLKSPTARDIIRSNGYVLEPLP